MNTIIKNYLNHIQERSKPKPPLFTREEILEVWNTLGSQKVTGYEFDKVAESIFIRLLHPKAKKGVCCCGSKGIGKTISMDIFSEINRDLFNTKTECWEVTEIEIQYRASGGVFMEHLSKIPCLIINDAGAESTLNDFGTTRNLIADLLFVRYRAFQVNGYKTHLTSNQKWETLLTHYGPRLADRMQEFMQPLELTEKSRRK